MSNEENQSRIKFINCKSVIFITIYEDITRDLRNILQWYLLHSFLINDLFEAVSGILPFYMNISHWLTNVNKKKR